MCTCLIMNVFHFHEEIERCKTTEVLRTRFPACFYSGFPSAAHSRGQVPLPTTTSSPFSVCVRFVMETFFFIDTRRTDRGRETLVCHFLSSNGCRGCDWGACGIYQLVEHAQNTEYEAEDYVLVPLYYSVHDTGIDLSYSKRKGGHCTIHRKEDYLIWYDLNRTKNNNQVFEITFVTLMDITVRSMYTVYRTLYTGLKDTR